MNGPSDPSAHSIPDIRRQIDDIDNTLLDLINQRLNLALQIGELKKTSGNPVMDAARENEILNRLTGRNAGPLSAESLRHIFGHFIAISREIQAPLTSQKNHVVDGLSMLVHQGALQFEHWTGEKAPVAEMEAAARGVLASNTISALSPQAVFLGGDGRGGGSKSDIIRIKITRDKKDLKKFQNYALNKLTKKTRIGAWRFLVDLTPPTLFLAYFIAMDRDWAPPIHWPTAFVFFTSWLVIRIYYFVHKKRLEKDFGGPELGESHLYSFTKNGVSAQGKNSHEWHLWSEIQEVERVKGMILLFIRPDVAYIFPEHKLKDPDGFYQSVMALYENAKKAGTSPQKNHLEGENGPQDMTGLANRLAPPSPDVFFPSISAATALYGVMGDPVGHSLSPVMHNAAFRKAGMDAVYTAFHVKDLKAAVAGIRAVNIRGVSVTLPHKIAIMDLLDDVEPAARSIGAVNTVVHRSGRLLGFNTDSPGAMAALMAQTPVAGKQVAVLGSGGAARAVAHGVTACGGNLVVVSRNETAGRQLAQDMNSRFSLLADFTGDGIDILINATSVGMAPDIDATPVPAHCLRPEMTVMDIVYTPLETRLLKDARAAGCRVVDGLSMLVHQGALQFEHWTGQKAPVAEMEAVAYRAKDFDHD